MRISSYAVARPAYYDRNAIGGRQYVGANYAPHSYTQRWQITCASGKKTFLESGFCRVYTNALPTTAGYVTAYITVTTGATQVQYSEAGLYQSLTTMQYIVDKPTLTCTLYAADTCEGLTSSFTNGGTMHQTVGLLYTTFDA